MQGFINVFKPQNLSSAKVVSKIKHKFNLNKVGHMGTLDPLACGILPIAIGKATRLFDYFLEKDKTYIAIFKFGVRSNTFDLDGNVEYNTGLIPSNEDILKVLPNFVGELNQLPPSFSAKVINGEKAYKLARRGENVELKPKHVTVYKFNLIEKVDADSFKFEITCSSGTYIRSLVRDVAIMLNTTGILSYLERTKSGYFSVDTCVKLDDLLNNDINNYIIPCNKVFPQFENLQVDMSDFTKIKNGLVIKTEHCDVENIFVFNDDVLLGVAQIKDNYLKLKTFLLDD